MAITTILVRFPPALFAEYLVLKNALERYNNGIRMKMMKLRCSNTVTAVLSSLCLSMAVVPAAIGAEGGPTVRPEQANLYIQGLHHGEQVTSPVRVRFGLSGMGVAPAGIEAANTGHHHLLIDVDSLPDLSQPLPATDHVKHFGKGQTEVQIELSPGQHTLQLVLGDYLHRPHSQPLMSKPITITVVE